MSPWRPPFRGSFIEPFRRADAASAALPAVDVTETDRSYDITAELPGMDDKNVDVKFANGLPTIKGEKQDYYLRETNFASFERTFQVPDAWIRTKSRQPSRRACSR